MTTCKGVHNLLAAYLENALSPEEKKLVEEHLTVCPSCRRDVADLKKTLDLLQNIEEVEPPPFFEQRIMAAIREEQKQSVWRRLFFPLYVKIPIQALATVFIAVFAFIVYQKSDPEIKQMAPPPAPVTETAKIRGTPETARQPSVSYPATRDGVTPPGAPQKQNHEQFALPPGAGMSKHEEIAASPTPLKEQRPAAAALKDAEITAKAEKSIIKSEAETMSIPPTLPSPPNRKSKKMAGVGSAAGESKDMISAPSSSPAAQTSSGKRSELNLIIRVPETSRGLQDVEACLNRFEARILGRKQRGETIFLKVQIDAKQIAVFVEKMKEIGSVGTNNKHLEFPAGNVAVDIRIDRLP